MTEAERRRLEELQRQSQKPQYIPPGRAEAVPTVGRPLEPAGPVYSPETSAMDETALVKRPVTTMADRYTASAVPMDEMSRARTVQPAGPEAGIDLKYDPATTPMVTYGSKGQPRGVEGGGDDLQRQQALLRAQQNYQPTDNNGRIRSALIGFARGRGLAGVVDPSDDERFANERDIARTTRSVATEIGQRKAVSDLENEDVAREHQRALTDKALRGPEYAPHYMQTAEGPVVVHGNRAEPITYQLGGERIKGAPPKGDKPTTIIQGETGRQEKWEVDADGKPSKQVAIKNERGEWLTPGATAMARATGGERGYRHERDVIGDTRHATERREDIGRHTTERQEDKGTAQEEKQQVRREKAGKLVGSLEGARQRWIAADAKVSELKQQAEAETDAFRKAELQDALSGWEFERGKAQKEAAESATELNTSHGDLYEAGIGDRGLAYQKARPFSVKQFRAQAKGAITKARIDAAVRAAKERGQAIVD